LIGDLLSDEVRKRRITSSISLLTEILSGCLDKFFAMKMKRAPRISFYCIVVEEWSGADYEKKMVEKNKERKRGRLSKRKISRLRQKIHWWVRQ